MEEYENLKAQIEKQKELEEHNYLNNVVELVGVVKGELEFSHEIYQEKFYKFILKVKRLSETEDELPIIVSEKLIFNEKIQDGTKLRVNGQFRSYNTTQNEKNHLELMTFAKEIEVLADDYDVGARKDFITNKIELHGFLCKKPIFRVTPFGREVTDLLLAVNRANNRSDYIPCIAWGRNARFSGNLAVGDEVKLVGRIQSRAYDKKIDENTTEKRIAYEISIITIELCSEENNEDKNEELPKTENSSEEKDSTNSTNDEN